MSQIKITTVIKSDIKSVFDQSRNIDFHQKSTVHTNEEAIDGKTSGLIEMNESVTWRAKHFGIYQKFTSQITAFQSPLYFVDEMTKGAFKDFRHEHHFKSTALGTQMIDVLNFNSPFGLLGKIIDALVLKKYLKNLLISRNNMLKEELEKTLIE